MTASRIFLYLCLAFVGGIFLNSLVPMPWPLIQGILISGILLISIFWRHRKSAIVGFCILSFVLGIWRHQSTEAVIVYPEDGNIEFIGIVNEELDIRSASLKLTVKAVENGSRPLLGKVLLTVSRYPEYQYGDKLKIVGLLKKPPIFDDFNYRDYLKKDGIYYVMDFPKIGLVGHGFGNPVMGVLLSFKEKFKKTSESFIPPPQVGFLEALVFGDESRISKEWKDKLNLTGTRHIAAVSGMNITIISGLILSFLLLLGLGNRQSFYIALGLIVLYVLMIGAPASAVRAGVMAGFFMLAKRSGRISLASRAIIFSAALMLFFNPLLLRLDVGFQLSFLAIMGLVYLQPSFSCWLGKVPDYKFFPVRTALAATLSAQIFTLPILIYNFGYVSLVSPVINMLIVPFLAPITILIFAFGFFGMISGSLGWILSWPVFFSLSYISGIIDSFSKFPLAYLRLGNIHWIWLAVSYLILLLAIWRLEKFKRPTIAGL